ncbi:hypothetical protein [Photobacterium minamisatsumaniensis]|uniref:hypothetical protein n=1 Tax=Photobacterium minamisatsumaniensis TaxID=2910233 RepID=UPI003D0C172F
MKSASRSTLLACAFLVNNVAVNPTLSTNYFNIPDVFLSIYLQKIMRDKQKF